MKIHLASDIHNEFGEYNPPPVDADLIVLAGDIHTKRRGPAWAKKAYPGKRIIMVGGNHEAYGDSLYANIKEHRDHTGGDFTFLEGDMTRFGGISFIGATLWTDFTLFGPSNAFAAKRAAMAMNDYHLIRLRDRKLAPQDTIDYFNQSILAIEAELEAAEGLPCVVITHHAPSFKSVADRYQTDILSAAYATDLEALIMQYQPLLWLHGHTHTSFDYKIGSTRVVCNPRGYAPYAINPNFDPQLILEI